MKLGVSHDDRIVEIRDDGTYVDRGPGASVLGEIGEPQGELEDVCFKLPFEVADYVDFYSSRQHAENMGRMFRPNAEPLTPNWLHLPIGYHGRAGTVVVSGTEIGMPSGQRGPGDFGPSQKLDFELEVGFVIGKPSDGPVAVEDALDHVFGVVLLNDWSARDIQAFEYVPLGPFLGKSFATSISACVTTIDELTVVPGEPQDPEPLPHLSIEPYAFDIPLEVELNGETISRTNARHLYWNVSQQIAHLTSNGATLRVGDLLGSGTISGPGANAAGSLIELTHNEGPFLRPGSQVLLRGEGLGDVDGSIRA